MLKRFLRYGLYFFAGLWMFALGVMVGRGNSPVTFDTREFQARLETIVREQGNLEKAEQKVDLKFYDVLNRPVGMRPKARKADEIQPKRESVPKAEAPPAAVGPDGVPVKLSKKMASLNSELLAAYQDAPRTVKQKPASPAPSSASGKVKAKKTGAKPKPAATGTPGGAAAQAGKYTIQVAAFKAAEDAASEMARLQKKGIEVYRVKGEKKGVTWYRIRTGAYPDYKAAQDALETLKNAKVKGMIIKKE
ncbi:MAG: SPOR domain-containing protein [Desulfobacter sp.]|nr:MAG: SPOR domain-containing protein [Desulfobacter sp.]